MKGLPHKKRRKHAKHARRTPPSRYIKALATTLVAAALVGSSLSIESALHTDASATSFAQHQKTIMINNQVFSRPYAFAASDGSNLTTYMPIWYVGKALEALGIRQSWNGITHTWTLTTTNYSKSASAAVGNGSAKVVVNGQVVKRLTSYVALDPASGKSAIQTVYMPIYYIQQILRQAGIDSSWDGQTWKVYRTPYTASSSSSGTPLLFGFVTAYNGDTSSLTDLESHPLVHQFSSPTVNITSTGGVSGQVYAAAQTYASTHHLDAFVTINNYSTSYGNFDGKMTEQVLKNPAESTALVNHIVSLVKNTPLKGANIDFELLPSSSASAFVQFLNTLAPRLHQVGKQLTVDVPGVTKSGSGYNYADIGKTADEVVVMAYDYSYPGGPAGPIAPLWWVKQVANYAANTIPASHVILGVPTYGYDWYGSTTTALSLNAVDKLLTSRHITPQWDSRDATPYFTYWVGSVKHTVYYENVQSITDKLTVVTEYHLKGVALWRMGLESPAVWNAIASYVNHP